MARETSMTKTAAALFVCTSDEERANFILGLRKIADRARPTVAPPDSFRSSLQTAVDYFKMRLESLADFMGMTVAQIRKWYDGTEVIPETSRRGLCASIADVLEANLAPA